MSLKFYNTMRRAKQEFHPLNPPRVTIYSCGPTVYDFAHIGNLRSYIFADILHRWLQYKGYEVFHVMNLTDVDDKTIRGAREKGISLGDYTQPYIESFFEDMDTLRIERAGVYPRATEHIEEMTELTERLREKGFTYQADGSTYYNISKFEEYGKLSRINLKGLRYGVRVDADEYTKENVRDFVLWKAFKHGELGWETRLGKGRPGWHIECSTMAMKYLGETMDIHTGGVDLIFPHHENEIAQSEGATGREFVRYWMHCEHLIVNGEKMSKSAGNFFTLRDLLDKGHDPSSIRYLLLSVHYRKILNFTLDGLTQAKSALERLWSFTDRLGEIKGREGELVGEKIRERVELARKDFEASMDDDLNTSAALGVVFDLVRDINPDIEKGNISSIEAREIISLIQRFDRVFCFLVHEKPRVDGEVKRLIEERDKARAEKDWAKADEIRSRLKEMGIILEDTPGGVRWRRK